MTRINEHREPTSLKVDGGTEYIFYLLENPPLTFLWVDLYNDLATKQAYGEVNVAADGEVLLMVKVPDGCSEENAVAAFEVARSVLPLADAEYLKRPRNVADAENFAIRWWESLKYQ